MQRLGEVRRQRGAHVDQARREIERSLGRTVESLFIDFGPPVAAASLAQAHPAWLADGRKVAIKVLRAHVASEIGAIAKPKQIYITPDLPKTRSGKILRGTMVKIADSQPWKMPATIDDPEILDEIAAALQGLGLAQKPSGV